MKARIIAVDDSEKARLLAIRNARVSGDIANRSIYMNKARRNKWLVRRRAEIKSLMYHGDGGMKLDSCMVIRRQGDERDCYGRMFRYRRLERAPKGWERVWVTGLGTPFGVGGFLKEPFRSMPLLVGGSTKPLRLESDERC